MENGSLAFLAAGEGPSGWGLPWVQGPSEIATLPFGKWRGAPTFEALQQYGEKYGFPAGAAPEVVSLAYGYAQFYEEQENKEGQQYFYTILYNLTGDEEIKAKLDKLDNGPRIILS